MPSQTRIQGAYWPRRDRVIPAEAGAESPSLNRFPALGPLPLEEHTTLTAPIS